MDIRQRLFQIRSYTPLPFIALMLVFAKPTAAALLAGGILAAAGESFRMWGVAIAGSETRTTGPVGGTFLVTTGPFAHVRNPLYLGNMLMYAGFGIMSNALFPYLPLAGAAWFLWQYRLIVGIEEEALASRFGEEYHRYCASVPRFFPAVRRYVPGDNPQPDLDWKRGVASERRTLQAIGLLTSALLGIWLVRG